MSQSDWKDLGPVEEFKKNTVSEVNLGKKKVAVTCNSQIPYLAGVSSSQALAIVLKRNCHAGTANINKRIQVTARINVLCVKI